MVLLLPSSMALLSLFVEHGYVFGFVCARADLTYQQGINKMWLRSTVYDFYWLHSLTLANRLSSFVSSMLKVLKLILLCLAIRNVMPNIVINLRRLQASSVAL